MICYERCSEVDIELVYKAFTIGFSDYIMKINISKDGFEKHFLGPEGNDLKHSFIALDDGKPVGLILGGIKKCEGIKTFRCGALCIHPDYRGKGISYKLFELHKEEGLKNNCKQLLLEVIVGNDRAVQFYRKVGYRKIYDLSYFSCNVENLLQEGKWNQKITHQVTSIGYKEIENLNKHLEGVHINWQNDLEYINRLNGQHHYGIYDGNCLAGALSINENGKINFLWIEPSHRNKKFATSLINYAVKQLRISKLSTGFTNNTLLEGFLIHSGFSRDPISQYEMYLFL